MLRIAAAALTVALASPTVAATPMTAGEFLARAEPLMAKSQISLLFSSEARRLMGATARRPPACRPRARPRVGATELIGYMHALTPAQKSQSFDSVFRSFAARKYPCRT